MRLFKKPELKKNKAENFNYYGDVGKKGRTLKIDQKIVLGKRIFKPSEWKDVKDGILQFNKFTDPIILKAGR